MRLYEYQKELLNSKSNKVLINWCRGAGSDTALAIYILEHKPQNTLYLGDNWEFECLLSAIRQLEKDYNVSVESKSKVDYIITFNETEKTINLTLTKEITGRFKYDLVIHKSYWKQVDKKYFDKYIVSVTSNSNGLTDFEDFEKIIVDYRMMLKENLSNLDVVINSVRHDGSFFREYAILDKRKVEEMTFEQFQVKALKKLQKQFLDTPDSKDTVLTRKNIIEMIKDLMQLK